MNESEHERMTDRNSLFGEQIFDVAEAEHEPKISQTALSYVDIRQLSGR
jgi:hypothetical protein